jgi:hypothetical protein
VEVRLNSDFGFGLGTHRLRSGLGLGLGLGRLAMVALAIDGCLFGRARKSSTSLLRVEVSNSWVVLGRGVEQISDGNIKSRRVGSTGGSNILQQELDNTRGEGATLQALAPQLQCGRAEESHG